eukprot:6301414-Pyramimonas_sp.AAC.1
MRYCVEPATVLEHRPPWPTLELRWTTRWSFTLSVIAQPREELQADRDWGLFDAWMFDFYGCRNVFR